MCEHYLISVHEEDILHILEDSDRNKIFSLNINFLELFESDTNLGNELLADAETSLKNWNEAVFNVQNNLLKEIDKKYSLKNNVSCRIYSLPPWPHICRTIFPGNDDANKFLQVTGTVVRMSVRKLLEYQRQYVCTQCKYPIMVKAQYDKRNIIKQPRTCTNPEGCTGKNIITFGELDPQNCKDYQEIKIQEDLSKMGVGTVPCHMVVTLEDDLVNVCKPGENVTITGIVKRRWSEFDKGVKIIVDIVLKANHVQVNNSSGLSLAVSDDMRQFFENFWIKHQNESLVGRNIILKSISPEIYGRQLVKLAMAIVLAGGSRNEGDQDSTGIDTRSESHLLLVGDPGTGKSQMLRYASKIIPRSVLTTGVGSTAAGLTVTAIMESGEWQLEAGALVMADGGICCIDEFNSMREHDRTSIHEAMEQQTISVAKAGMVCKLKTRCSILAACNPKGNIDPSQPLCVNVAMSSPLLSRFDLILLLRDIVNEENDRKLADYLLNKGCELTEEGVFWSLEKLQAYYAIIKKESPKLASDSERILSTYYQLQRKFGSRNKSRTTVRLLESLIRLSQGHAKLIYHSEVQVIDTIFAIILVDAALDYESSLLNLNIDYDAFFNNPEQMYWDLLEKILGKLNLDDIYQREIEKTGINIKSSQNTNQDSSQRGDNNPNLGHSQSFVTGTPKRTQLLFTQRIPSQIHERTGINSTQTTNQGQSHEHIVKNTNNFNSQFLFSQSRSKVVQNHRIIDQASQACQSPNETMDNTQSQSRLLFSPRVQEKRVINPKNSIEKNPSHNTHHVSEENRDLFPVKNDRVLDNSSQNISDDSGNISNSSQELTKLFGESRLNLTQERNSTRKFSIYQNNCNSFARNPVALNLRDVSSSKSTEHSKMSNTLNAPKNLKHIPQDSGWRGNKEGGLKRKNMTLSEGILRSNIYRDFCYRNNENNSGKFKDDSTNFNEKIEESGFGSQNIGNSIDQILDESNKTANERGSKRNLRSPNSESKTGATKKYISSSDDKTKMDSKKGNRDLILSPEGGKKRNKHEAMTDINLLNLMPSINDDFMKYDLDIDWDIQENSSDLSEDRDNLRMFSEKRQCQNNTTKISNDQITRYSENTDILQEIKENNMTENIHEQTSKVRTSVVDLTKQKKAKEIVKDEEKSRSSIEDNLQSKISKRKAANETEINQILENMNNGEPGPSKKFTFVNKHRLPSLLEKSPLGDNKIPNNDKNDNSNGVVYSSKKFETHGAKFNFRRLASDVDLGEGMRTFCESSFQNPFSRSLSNATSKLASGNDKRVESEKTCETIVLNEIGNGHRIAKENGVTISTSEKESKTGSKSNFGHLYMDLDEEMRAFCGSSCPNPSSRSLSNATSKLASSSDKSVQSMKKCETIGLKKSGGTITTHGKDSKTGDFFLGN